MSLCVNLRALSILAILALEPRVRAGDRVIPQETPCPQVRRDFHMSMTYPFTFAPEGYLASAGPNAMRYGAPAQDYSTRTAPALPESARGVDPFAKKKDDPAAKAPSPSPAPKPAPAPAPQAQASPTPDLITPDRIVTTAQPDVSSGTPTDAGNPNGGPDGPGGPAFPVPQNAPTPVPKDGADFSKAPDEVDGYFRNQYNFVPDTHRFFDPIFEPAQAPDGPNAIQTAPHSSATYTETK